jgi:hypothetical protein
MATRFLSTRSGADARAQFPRRLILAAVGAALAILALGNTVTVGAQPPAGCIPINYTTCASNGYYYYTNAPVGTTYAPTYTSAPAPAPVPAPAPATTSSGYPPNVVVSSYFDPRYCGNGAVSVVTDGSGNLINVCTGSGVRIYPAYPDYGYGYSGAYIPNGNYPNGYFPNGCPSGNFSCLAAQPYGYYP